MASSNHVETSTITPTEGTVRGIEEDGIDAGIEREQEKQSILRRVWTIVTWTPPNCRWDPNKPPQFSMSSKSKLLVVISFYTHYTHHHPRTYSYKESH